MDEMTKRLSSPEIRRKRELFKKAFGKWAGFSYDSFASLSDYIRYLDESVQTGVEQKQYLIGGRNWEAILKLQKTKK